MHANCLMVNYVGLLNVRGMFYIYTMVHTHQRNNNSFTIERHKAPRFVLQYHALEDTIIDVQWLDTPPDEATQHKLFNKAKAYLRASNKTPQL